jgi:antitoxin PrlF
VELDILHGITTLYTSITPEATMATTVTSKGQVTIPKPVRDHLGIVPGSQIAFRRAADGSIVVEKADGTRQPSRFAKVIGSAGPGPSTDEIMALLRGNDP